MELTPVQRLVTFAVVVLVLAGLGLYLFLPKSSPGASAQQRPSQTTGHHSVSPSPGDSGSSPSSSPPSSDPAGPPSAGNSPNIYNWLPFTPSGLASAARVATTFAADYGTYSYRQNTASYLAPMKALMTGQLADLIGRAYSAPGLVAQRTSGKQVAVGSAVISSLRAFGPSSITFVVTLTERMSGTNGSSRQSNGFSVTLTGSGGSWQVNNIEPSDEGNQ